MTARTAAGAVWLLAVVIFALGLSLPLFVGAPLGIASYAEAREVALIGLADATLGAIILRRQPRHPIGWLFLGLGLGHAIQVLAGEWAGAIPGAAVAAWIAVQLQFVVVLSTAFVLQLFPTGHLLPGRWRAVPWVTVTGMALEFVGQGLRPGPLENLPGHINPFGVLGAAGALDAMQLIGAVLAVLGVLGGIASLGVRLRRSEGVERQQVKWLFYAAALSVALLFGSNALFSEAMESQVLGSLVWGGAGVSMSAAVTFAIVRYRLYDIDRIISRTVTYGLLTAGLGTVYVSGVALLAPLAGDSDLAVAGSTLAVAALFGPARRRVQGAVDRRFNRARFDARRTVDSFSTRLRDEVDLDELSGELLGVVGQTMQPARVSLWLAS